MKIVPLLCLENIRKKLNLLQFMTSYMSNSILSLAALTALSFCKNSLIYYPSWKYKVMHISRNKYVSLVPQYP